MLILFGKVGELGYPSVMIGCVAPVACDERNETVLLVGRPNERDSK